MTLVREAGVRRSIRRRLTVAQELPREAYAPLHEISVRCDADVARKTAQELEPADATKSGQLGERHGRFWRGLNAQPPSECAVAVQNPAVVRIHGFVPR